MEIVLSFHHIKLFVFKRKVERIGETLISLVQNTRIAEPPSNQPVQKVRCRASHSKMPFSAWTTPNRVHAKDSSIAPAHHFNKEEKPNPSFCLRSHLMFFRNLPDLPPSQ
jgi:hypothetical protein